MNAALETEPRFFDMQWCADEKVLPDKTVHVWPLPEEGEHVLHGTSCECIPKVRRYKSGRILVTHRSFKYFASRKAK